MSAAEVLSLENSLHLELAECCRFCRCTETTPCTIAIAQDANGTMRLARHEEEIVYEIACSWYMPGVCNAPRCIQKLVAEWDEKVLLFDSTGRKVG